MYKVILQLPQNNVMHTYHTLKYLKDIQNDAPFKGGA